MTALAITLICIATILVVIWIWYLRDELRTEQYKLKWEKERTQNWYDPTDVNRLKLEHAQDLLAKVSDMKMLADQKAQERFEAWRTAEIEGIRTQEQTVATEQAMTMYYDWLAQKEGMIRADAVKRSGAVTKGKITEHLVPFFPSFKYNSKDARFSGSPIDLIVYNGLSEGNLEEIVFIEVKTRGKPINH